MRSSLQTTTVDKIAEAFEASARRCFGKRLSRLEWTEKNPFESSAATSEAYLHVSLTLSDQATSEDLDKVMSLAFEVEDRFERTALIEPHLFDAA